MPRVGLGDDGPIWDRPGYQGDWDDKNLPKVGSAGRYITDISDATGSRSFDPNKKIGSLADQADRFRVINELNSQNGGNGNSEEACGAYVLLAGSLLAGGGKDGTKGLQTLMSSVEAFRKKNGGSLDPEKLKQEGEEFAKLREKMAKGEQLSAGDLNTIANDVYDMMKVQGRDGSDAGMKHDRVTALMQQSPELRKMWKDNKLSYDTINPYGGKVGGHAVLGIGGDDPKNPGQHVAVYDPYHRTNKDPALQRAAIDSAAEVERLKESLKNHREYNKGGDPETVASYEARIKEAQQAAETARRREVDSHTDLGQVVTDPRSLAAYRATTNNVMRMTDKGVDQSVPTPAAWPPHTPGVFDGMY